MFNNSERPSDPYTPGLNVKTD